MKNIYDVSFEVLVFIVGRVEAKYTDEEKINKVILKFLTTDKTTFEEDAKVCLKDMLDLDLAAVKRICMLIIASKNFIFNNYEYHYGINEEKSQEMVESQKNYDVAGVLRDFYDDPETVEEWIDTFRSYINSTYIEQNGCIELGLKEYKKEILRMNPYEIFEFYSYIPSSMLLPSEKAIQTYMNLYEKTLCYTYEDKNGEEEQYENNDEFLHSTLIDYIYEEFPTEKEANTFLQYIISNVYEALTISVKEAQNKEKKEILAYIEKEPMADIINRFKNDYAFAIKINDLFLSSNDFLCEDELFDRREDFKKKGNIRVLKRINPYYYEEEVVYERAKKESKH